MTHLHPYVPCIRCGKKASWSYVPGNWDYCEDCVPRGCSCNTESVLEEYANQPPTPTPDGTWKWLKENEIWTKIDEKGRQYPCVEYWRLDEEDHTEQSRLDFAWEEYYKEHEDQRPQTDAERIEENFDKKN